MRSVKPLVKPVKLHCFLSGSCSWSTHGADGWIVGHGCPAGLGGDGSCLNLPGVPRFTHRVSAFRWEGAVQVPIPSDWRRGRRLEQHCEPQRPCKKDRDRSLKQWTKNRFENNQPQCKSGLSTLHSAMRLNNASALGQLRTLSGENHVAQCLRLPAEHYGCEKYSMMTCWLPYQAPLEKTAVWTGKRGFQTVHPCSCTLTF